MQGAVREDGGNGTRRCGGLHQRKTMIVQGRGKKVERYEQGSSAPRISHVEVFREGALSPCAEGAFMCFLLFPRSYTEFDPCNAMVPAHNGSLFSRYPVSNFGSPSSSSLILVNQKR